MKSIKEWCEELNKTALKNGFITRDQNTPQVLCLIHSEALEAYRDYDDEGFKEELADVAIRLFEACEAYDIDLEDEIHKKNEKNKKREFRHGGKRC